MQIIKAVKVATFWVLSYILNTCNEKLKSVLLSEFLILDFEPGDPVLEDEYGVAGPSHKTEDVCLNCLTVLNHK